MESPIFLWPPTSELPAEYVGVVLKRLSPGWLHIGFLYRRANDCVSYVLENLGHLDLRHAPAKPGHLCVLYGIEAVRLPAIAALARNVWNKNKKGFPYAFSSPGQDFSTVGELLLRADRLGLNCSTFVLAVYQAAGFPLVRSETWQERPEDQILQESVLQKLRSSEGATPEGLEHLTRVEQEEVGSALCRPEEVAAAALADKLPCDFDTAVRFSAEIIRQLPVVLGDVKPG